jgi:hypothetical protein
MPGSQWIAVAATFSFLLGSPSVWAKTLKVGNTQAQGQNKLLSVKVWPGYGLNVSFIGTGEAIIKAWLDDPSRVVMDLDGLNETASVVHLRRIKVEQGMPLMASSDGATLLTVVTESDQGRKLYQIRVLPTDGAPEYFTVSVGAAPVNAFRGKVPSVSTVKPSVAPNVPKPVPVQPQQKISFQPLGAVQAPKPIPQSKLSNAVKPEHKHTGNKSVAVANAAVRGLIVANREGSIRRGSTSWYKVQTAVILLRRGKTREASARLAGLDLAVFEKVIALGQG